MTESDAELVRRSVDGDLAAFETLITRYERSVRSVARAFLADAHACEDATQEIFVAAFRAIQTLRERDRFGAWLMQIARRVSGKLQGQHSRIPIPGDISEPAARNPQAANAQAEFLLSAIERLPEQERLVVTMRYFDGHRTQEIADATGIPLGTVTKQLSRAYLYDLKAQQDLLATLRSLHKSVAAVAIPTKEIRGVECPGFRIEERQSTLSVWVDRQSRLPVYAERSFFKALGADDPDVLQFDEMYEDMKFDEPIADEMFSVVPPAGYAVTTIGTPPADRKDLFAEPLIVTPNIGVGPLKFGMPRAEIIRLLGQPDEETFHVPNFTVSDDTDQVDDKVRPKGAALVVLTEFHFLHYDGLGFRLTVEARDGLTGIQCFGQDSLGPQGRTFRGATAEGIRVGSSVQDVLKAYGKPDEQSDHELSYNPLHLKLALTERQTVRSISLSDADSHPLHFEWRVPNNK
ncbi:MAG TPA: sigma-70 family RNA polymerase sigma factor [Planctomycetaceae bacterium]|jgi:RNA polymerase sigma-70 factor (ECF subfamily)